jgi:coenzyme F420-reducing hydrogenase delta subunit
MTKGNTKLQRKLMMDQRIFDLIVIEGERFQFTFMIHTEFD